MTTAARPTFAPQHGGTSKQDTVLSSISKQYSARDVAAHTKLKYRQPGQGSKQDLADKDFLNDLGRREEDSRKRSRDHGSKGAIEHRKAETEKLQLNVTPNEEDADEPLEKDIDEDDKESKEEAAEGSDDEDEEDDTEELMRELQRIKRERLEDQARKEAAAAAERERINLTANPLLRGDQGNFTVKRRWDDDVVFKNCAKQDKRKETEFINDTLRSEFHRKFMSKYIV